MNTEQFEQFINQDFNSFSDWLFSLNAYEFSLIPIIIGLIISPTLTVNQQNSLGNFFELLGQVIISISAQNMTLQQDMTRNSNIDSNSEINILEKEIFKLKQEIIQLRNDYSSNNK